MELNDTVVPFPGKHMEGDKMDEPFHISVEDCLDGILEEGANQVVAFYTTGDGQVYVTSNISAEETDNLIDEGIAEYERLCEYTDEDEEEVNG